MTTTNEILRPTTRTISTDELHRRLSDPGLTIVDVRPIAAYNGWRLQRRGARRPHPGRRRVPGGLARQRRRGRDRAPARREGHHARPRRSSSTATAPRMPAPLDARLAALGHRRRPRLRGRLPGLGGRRPPAGRAPAQLRHASSTSTGSRELLAGERPGGLRQRASSCCSTSTSASPRSTRRATSRAPSTSTRTGSRTRPTGTAARPTSIDAALRAARHHPRHDGRRLRPRHRGRRQREVAGPTGRADRRDPRGC